MIFGYDRLSTKVCAKDARESDDDGRKKEGCHNNEGKDPLEGNDLSQKLTNTEGSSENAECETHRIVLESNEEEQSID